MERTEFKMVIALLNTIYSEHPPCPNQIAFDCWYAKLGDKPKEVVDAACDVYISTEHYPPKPADILKLCADITSNEEPSELEAWAMVYKAICNSAYNAEKEYNKLPKLAQKAIGSYENLKEMAKMDINTVNSVEQSHFISRYRTEMERAKRDNQLPDNTKMRISQLKETYALSVSEDPNVIMIAGNEISELPSETKQHITESNEDCVIGSEYVEKLKKDMKW